MSNLNVSNTNNSIGINQVNETNETIETNDTHEVNEEAMSDSDVPLPPPSTVKNENGPNEADSKKLPEFVDDSDEETPRKGVVGLNNLGNTCYLNSVLQTISNLDDFRTYLLSGTFVNELKDGIELEDSLFYQTHRIIKSLWETDQPWLGPKSFRRKFVEKQEMFQGSEQHDSHEAMQSLLDNLHEEIKKNMDVNISISPELKGFFEFCDKHYSEVAAYNSAVKSEEGKEVEVDKEAFEQMKLKWKTNLKIIDSNPAKALDYFAMKFCKDFSTKYSEIYDFFASIDCVLTKCPDCNHMSYGFDNKNMISVEFPELSDDKIKESEVFKKLFAEKCEQLKEKISNEDLISKMCVSEVKQKQIFSLNDLLVHNQQARQLDVKNLWNCEVCEKQVQGLQQCKLYKNPKYLIVHLKRFNHLMIDREVDGRIEREAIMYKIKNLVTYDEKINIRHLMINDDGSKMDYEIVGGINHMGEYAGGHYTNFSKNANKWYNYNDHRVNELHCNGIPLSPNAYMLIYRRCD
jgi:ubiquitin C-terminal hydrolase